MAAVNARQSTGRSPMSDAHKAALAEGREQGRVIRRYLEALEHQQSRRARAKSLESIDQRLRAIEERLLDADPITRLKLIQERIDLNQERENAEDEVDIDALERGFIKYAAAYSQRKGISYAAWREIGVRASVLRDAGINRTASGDEDGS